LPLFHVGGLFMATGSFHAGVLNVNMSKFDAALAVSLIEEKKVSVMFDFSPILGSILEEHKKSGKNIKHYNMWPDWNLPQLSRSIRS
jgi:acyl-CoA synthetase (AMP-forming)/AMP-acid ligase II